jgi:hypothetical protein
METKIIANEQTTKHAAPKPAPAKAVAKKRHPKKSVAPGKQSGSPEAKRAAAIVLEVLAGERRPAEAASVLGVSIMRYYVIESRALQGLLHACEPRPRGKQPDPERAVARMQHRVDTLQRDMARYQALARACNRTIGIAPVKKTAGRKKKGSRKRRTPTVRALKAAKGFRSAAADAKTASDLKPAVEKHAAS